MLTASIAVVGEKILLAFREVAVIPEASRVLRVYVFSVAPIADSDFCFRNASELPSPSYPFDRCIKYAPKYRTKYW